MFLRAVNLKKSFPFKKVFKDISFVAREKDIIGIIGNNGEGKSTLLKILAGQLKPEQGHVVIEPKYSSFLYTSQYLNAKENQTIEEYIITSNTKLRNTYKKINSVNQSTSAEDINKFIEYQTQFEELGGFNLMNQIPKYLSELGLKEFQGSSSISSLSGGQKTRLKLVPLVIENYSFLFLDEPTNHLDQNSIDWLQEFIQKFQGISFIVSHDRAFLNKVTTKIIEIKNGKAYIYEGNFDQYIIQKQKNVQKDKLLYEVGMKKINQLTEISNSKLQHNQMVNNTVRTGSGADVARRKSAKNAKSAKIIQKRIEKTIEANMPLKFSDSQKIKFEPEIDIESSNSVLKIENLEFHYGSKTIIKQVNLSMFKKDKICLLGENGSGKSTLLKLIANELKCTKGKITLGTNVKMGYFSQELNVFDESKSILNQFRKFVSISDEESRTYLHQMLLSGDQVFQDIETLSFGEKSKLFLAILLYQKNNFLILDEPTNNLDIESKEIIEEALKNFEGTLLVVSHDKYFIEKIGINRLLYIDHGNVIENYNSL